MGLRNLHPRVNEKVKDIEMNQDNIEDIKKDQLQEREEGRVQERIKEIELDRITMSILLIEKKVEHVAIGQNLQERTILKQKMLLNWKSNKSQKVHKLLDKMPKK